MKTFDIRFSVEKNRVRLYLHLPQGVYTFDTPYQITEKEWNYVEQRPENPYTKNAKIIYNGLNRIKITVANWLRDEKVNKPDIQKGVQACMLQAYRQKSIVKGDNLAHQIQVYIESRKHIIEPNTLKRYHVFLRLVQRFEGYAMKNFKIKEVDASFVKQFIQFGTEENYSPSTLYRTISFIQTVLNFLEKRGIRTFAYELELPRIKKKTLFVTLTEEELNSIKQAVIPSQLQHARDWLLISCYTGQRISDFMNFCSDMLHTIKDKKCLAFQQQKTGKDILLPLHPEVLHIIKKYPNKFPPKISEQLYNRQIKEFAKLANIHTLVYYNKRSGHRCKPLQIPKWQAISSHIGRRSFASNFYGKIPTPLLMEATGHGSEGMFHNYINQMDIQRTITLGKYFEHAYERSPIKEQADV
ncbi:tyrosine-type recombinase/integrase [Sphingobacterium sp. SGR-19]|uniref:tyrosine-type recombinase/integrase n=1 Tax=Sphingobacterium sp. SGR-19 TaxID=2710886 RepID=UPI0013ECC2AE|nr:tyrosine-type recombinase/integrase [Sphingobacterium sp. SGR-19]NGM63964.1 tyrosine-type recombinase/integrase [Sphingobacterium sp. SGR-19]